LVNNTVELIFIYKDYNLLYQLPNGKVIEISTEQYLDMSDEELEYLIAYNYGDVQENPWFGSVISKSESFYSDKSDFSDDLIEIPNDDKLSDLDIDPTLIED
jgi:hypothetical protein